jgi:hypothetical protein
LPSLTVFFFFFFPFVFVIDLNSNVFTDITVGWDSTNGARDKSAFPATKGW